MSKQLYDILSRTITKLNSTNNDTNYCRSDINKLQNKLSVKQYDVHITSEDSTVNISLRGSGKVTLLTPYDFKVVELQEGEYTNVVIDNPQKEIFIEDASSILELDIHGQRVSGIEFLNNCPISKLAAYDNELTSLDLSNCNQLQFLHIHNNPMCDNDYYIESLVKCMDSLTDRFMAATGSIIFYPWYGLELLVCKKGVDSYVKYPNGVEEIELQPDTLYGVVENNEITYYTYEPWDMIEHTSMNRHHTIRKQLEQTICLRKNWVFGSAVMYSDDWKYCTWDFRKNNVADMWETAEKGFGLTWGGIDKFTNTFPGFDKLNIVDTFRHGNPDMSTDTLPKMLDYTKPSDWDQFRVNNHDEAYLTYNLYRSGDYTHGDSILSLVFGTQFAKNPKDRRFGYIPNAGVAICDNMSTNGYPTIKMDALYLSISRLAKESDVLSMSFGLNPCYEDYLHESKRVLQSYGKDNPVCISCGNDGDGLPYTNESKGFLNSYAGDYIATDGDGKEVKLKNNSLFIASCDHYTYPSNFSSCSPDATVLETDRVTYLTQYGDGLAVWNNTPQDGTKYAGCASKKAEVLQYGAGTSYSCPLCSAMLILFKNVYKKMFPEETSFGKYSNFLNHVRKRWCIHNDNVMDMAVGYGLPNVLAEPYAPQLLNEIPEVTYDNKVKLGDNIHLTYNKNNPYSKKGYTINYNYDQVAVAEDQKIYPLLAKDKLSITLHSNSSVEDPKDYDANYYSNKITVKVKDDNVQEVGKPIKVCNNKLSNEYIDCDVMVADGSFVDNGTFTVQFAIDFSDKLFPKDSGSYTTERELLYVLSGDEYGYLNMRGMQYNTANKYVDFTKNTAFTYDYFKAHSERKSLLPASKSIGWGIGNAVSKCHHTAIITLTASPSGMKVYYNGSYIGGLLNVPDMQLRLSKIFINSESLCHDIDNCVRMFDYLLTQEEIIQNTISMLNKHFNEEE